MAMAPLEVMVVFGALWLLLQWRDAILRRNAATWESLIARLSPGWNAVCPPQEEQTKLTDPENQWQRVHGVDGLCTIYRDAVVMSEIASYAARHGKNVDPELIASLHSDALQIRIRVALALGQYAVTRLNATIAANATAAADAYAQMRARMQELMHVEDGNLVPHFSAAI